MNNEKILVSIVVSTFNQECYLEDCLKAILNDIDNLNLEIIISDDCSTDNTKNIALKYLNKYPNIFIVPKNNTNVGANFNYLRAHSLAKGKYVAHIDGDDIAMPNKIIKQVNLMESRPDVNLVVHAAEYFSDNNVKVSLPNLLNPDQKEWTFYKWELACWGPISVHSSYMYRRSSLKIKDITVPFMEWSIAMNVLSSGKGVFLNERLIRYRKNINSSAWTSTVEGRNVSYNIQWINIIFLFDSEKSLRKCLYAQVFVNTLAIIKNKSSLPNGMVWWLFKNCLYFNPLLCIDSFRKRLHLRIL
jgi:glycosyltransferase involved in cell wall biosynthesis